MENYRPSNEVLTACGFRPSFAPNQWCHMQGVHMHYVDSERTIEVYNGLPHPLLHLISQDDEGFRAEVQAIVSTAQPARLKQNSDAKCPATRAAAAPLTRSNES